ncbi:hypothetical protein ACMD2_15541 [Ananas comosus]|uniref:Uncharacterized protein n=1 Tax=Ananas comosus TaxID=4615 RepID=A0A199VBM3_ANACO|nr:hypothetical protein ACMD2_15541 [Ananas comosus]
MAKKLAFWYCSFFMGSPLWSTKSEVVMIADLIAAGDQCGCTLFISAATPLRCGVDIEVPETMLKARSVETAIVDLVSAGAAHAAKMFIPGPVTSGFIIPGLAFPGPLEEKNATVGAGDDPSTVPSKAIVAVGALVELT